MEVVRNFVTHNPKPADGKNICPQKRWPRTGTPQTHQKKKNSLKATSSNKSVRSKPKGGNDFFAEHRFN